WDASSFTALRQPAQGTDAAAETGLKTLILHVSMALATEPTAMPNPMLPRERCDFSAIVDRPPLKLPGRARLVFWTIVNYEVWDIAKPMARQVLPAPTGQVLIPDVCNWSWHEYGMRVGAWRFFELYKRLGIKPTLAINAR